MKTQENTFVYYRHELILLTKHTKVDCSIKWSLWRSYDISVSWTWRHTGTTNMQTMKIQKRQKHIYFVINVANYITKTVQQFQILF